MLSPFFSVGLFEAFVILRIGVHHRQLADFGPGYIQVLLSELIFESEAFPVQFRLVFLRAIDLHAEQPEGTSRMRCAPVI